MDAHFLHSYVPVATLTYKTKNISFGLLIQPIRVYQMSIIEGPDRGQRLHVSISTHRQRRQGGARHALPTRRICRNRRGRIKRVAKFGRRRARVNQFEYFFRCRHGNGYLPPWASHTMFAILLSARLNKRFHTKQRIFIAHNLSM